MEDLLLSFDVWFEDNCDQLGVDESIAKIIWDSSVQNTLKMADMYLAEDQKKHLNDRIKLISNK